MAIEKVRQVQGGQPVAAIIGKNVRRRNYRAKRAKESADLKHTPNSSHSSLGSRHQPNRISALKIGSAT
jgi:hypothetical protein